MAWPINYSFGISWTSFALVRLTINLTIQSTVRITIIPLHFISAHSLTMVSHFSHESISFLANCQFMLVLSCRTFATATNVVPFANGFWWQTEENITDHFQIENKTKSSTIFLNFFLLNFGRIHFAAGSRQQRRRRRRRWPHRRHQVYSAPPTRSHLCCELCFENLFEQQP